MYMELIMDDVELLWRCLKEQCTSFKEDSQKLLIVSKSDLTRAMLKFIEIENEENKG